ncbi:MAG: histidine kinase [Wenzhouxiangella sp.]|jgi:signal transduction histidine kinase|nr:histidine kinase [Wenzhouxiangella sp.]
MRTSIGPDWSQLNHPLAWAAYLAIAGVYVSVTGLFGLPGDGLGWAGQLCLLGFALIWLVMMIADRDSQRSVSIVALVGLAACAFGLLLLGRSNTGPILLVLVAIMTVSVLRPRSAVLALLVANLAFALILRYRWGWQWNWALTQVMTFGAFQAFASLIIYYANRAEAAAEELREVNANLMATRSLLSETARDQERLRVSRELHDVAGHKLTALKLNLHQLGRHSGLSDNAELKQATGLAGDLLEDLRAVVRQLRENDGISLAQGIEQLTAPMPSPELHLSLDPALRVPRAEQAEALLRVIQEGLTNAARHGRARHAWLALDRRDGKMVLHLEDDGRLKWPLTPGNGLTFMRERLSELGGELDLAPSPRGGLSLTARLPLENAV